MSRRIQPIFDAILADDRCIGGTRTFIESLQEQYTRKKTLSQGQRRALTRVEEQLASAPALDADKQSRLDNLISRAEKAQDPWAVNFITSIKGQLSMGRELSPRQKEILVKVGHRHSDKAQEQRENWDSNFTSEMREKMKIAAYYYLANPPYFAELAKSALDDDAFIPSERAYKKMVENKYAAKVIASTQAEPKFKAGSHVQLRSNAQGHPFLSGITAVVLKADSKPVTSPARGSKVYSLLFFGKTEAVHVEERWLKKAKR